MTGWFGTPLGMIVRAEERCSIIILWCKTAPALAFAAAVAVWAIMDCIWSPVTPDVDHSLPPAECFLTSRPAQLPSIRVMQALATNDRHLAGARCPGSLIGPTVRMLA